MLPGYQGKNSFAAFGLYGMGAGEAAKGRQYRIFFSKIKAGQAQGLPAASGYADGRVNVPAEKIACFGFTGLGIMDVVHEGKGPAFQPAACQLDTGRLIPVILQDIMVAHHQVDLQLAEILPPFQEPVMLKVAAAVKQITDHQHPGRLELLEQAEKPVEVFAENFLRYGNAGLPEMPGFAEVQVAQYQGLFLFPVQAPASAQQEAMVMQLVWKVGLHRLQN